jgi:mannose-6-phosphate isomerase-like protein (cupin superfamily)
VKTIELRSLTRFSSDKMQKNGVFSTDHLTVDLYCFEPGQAQRSHKYTDADKVYFILEGTGRFTVGRTTREFRAGTAVLVPANEEHGVINMTEERLVMLTFVAPPPVIKP